MSEDVDERRPEPAVPTVPAEVTVRPATPDRWDDVVEVFGKRGDDPGWCWCQRFLTIPRQPGPGLLDNRGALAAEIARAPVPPGLVAYVDGQPAGWTRMGPRAAFPGVSGNRALARVLDGDGLTTWWVTCFAVGRRHRKSGVASALLHGAVELARDHGAAAVEGHPVDVAGLRADRVGASALFTGTKALFAGAGFVEVARTSPTRPVMRRVL